MPTAPPSPQGSSDGPSFGNTPVTSATPNRGFEAAALQKVGLLAHEMSRLLTDVGPTSEVGRVLAKILPQLLKLVPPGSVSPAGEKNQLQQMMLGSQQRNQQMAALKQQLAQQGMPKPPQGKPGMPGMPQMPQAA
jgi:hypothetical protein